MDEKAIATGEGYHVVVVEDDDELRPLIATMLRRSNFRVTGARTERELQDILAGAAAVDLILLDVLLPGRSGIEICRSLRAVSDVPIIMLTALGEPSDKVIGLEIGADDYVVKPPHPRELLARINAVLRRKGRGWTGEAPRDAARFANWTLDTRQRNLLAPDGQLVDLTSGEYDLLLAFVERPQRVLSREQLLDLSRGRAFGGTERSVDAQVSRLRAKLSGGSNEENAAIKTVRGAGYMLAHPVTWQ